MEKKAYLHPRLAKPRIGEIRNRISECYQAALEEAKTEFDFRCYYSAGIDLLIVANNERYFESNGNTAKLYKPTFARLHADAQNLANQYGKPMTILVQGSIDGADSPHAYHNGDYQPHCADWDFELVTVQPAT